MAGMRFKVLFCERFNCPAAKYEDRAFEALLYSHARWAVAVLRPLNSAFFEEDFRFINCLGAVTNIEEVQAETQNFEDANHYRGGFFRRRLKFRVSGRKAVGLAHELFHPHLVAH
jgi:hypothetical protein